VQDTLETALAEIAGAPVEVTAAGRTDRGVHARAQVVHFDTSVRRPGSAWVRGVNALLPDSVAVLWSKEMPDDFHARYSAVARTYRYLLLNRPVRPALEATRVGWCHAPLNLESMKEAAVLLVGEHDFSAFRSSECQAKTPVRTLHALQIERQGERIDFVLRANAFLHHMVRNIVGALIDVGSAKRPPDWIADLLAAADRTRGAATFSADGLYFRGAEYDGCFALPPTMRDICIG
jgi:tRNA pseudouridine38-40 synthase